MIHIANLRSGFLFYLNYLIYLNAQSLLKEVGKGSDLSFGQVLK